VDTVIDHFQPTACVLNEREHRSGRTMMQTGHCIEGVGQQGGPCIDSRPSLLERRRRVTDRDNYTGVTQDLRRLGEVMALRRHCDLAQSAVGRAQQPFNQLGIGVAKKGRIVRAAILASQERTLEVDSEDRRVSPDLGRRKV
jgi:hypothetical protein